MIAGGGSAVLGQLDPAQALARFARFDQVVDLVRARRDMKLLVEVETYVQLVKYSPGRIEFQPGDAAPPDLASRLAGRLQGWTGVRWGVSVVSSGGAATILETRNAERSDMQGKVLQHPLLQAVMAQFPGAEIRDIRSLEEITADPDEALEMEMQDEDWDPFEDD